MRKYLRRANSGPKPAISPAGSSGSKPAATPPAPGGSSPENGHADSSAVAAISESAISPAGSEGEIKGSPLPGGAAVAGKPRETSVEYRVIALDPHPATKSESITHPHVQDERLCEGEGHAAIAAGWPKAGFSTFSCSSPRCSTPTAAAAPTSNWMTGRANLVPIAATTSTRMIAFPASVAIRYSAPVARTPAKVATSHFAVIVSALVLFAIAKPVTPA